MQSKNFPNNSNPNAAMNQLKVDLSTQVSLHCPKCMSNLFIMSHQLFELSPLVSVTPTPQIVKLDHMACAGCSWIGTIQQMLRMTPEDRSVIEAKVRLEAERLRHEAAGKGGTTNESN